MEEDSTTVMLTNDAYEMFYDKYSQYECHQEFAHTYCVIPHDSWWTNYGWIVLVIVTLLVLAAAAWYATHRTPIQA